MADASAQVVISARYEDEATAGMRRMREEMASLAAAAGSLGPVESGLNRTAENLAAFRDAYREAMGELRDISRDVLEGYVAGSYMAVAEAMSAWVAGAKGGAKEFSKAMLELSAQAVLAIGRQAAVKAVFAMAEFFLFKDPMALAAAKLYGTVATMAVAAGASMTAAAGKMNAGSPAGGSRGTGSPGRHGGERGPVGEREVNRFTVNVHVQGHVVDTRAFVEDVVAPSLAEAVGKGAASRAKYNLVVTRD